MSVAGPGTPSYCNIILKQLTDTLRGEENIPALEFRNSFATMYDDDSFLAESSTGVAVMWPIRQHPDAWWHNSAQDMDYIDRDAFAVGTAINLTLVDGCVNPAKEVIGDFAGNAVEIFDMEIGREVGSHKEHYQRRLDIIAGDISTLDERFAEEKATALKALWDRFTVLCKNAPDNTPHSPWRDYVENIVVSRKCTGFPYDLAVLPVKKRRVLPARVLYGPLASMLSNMDGKHNLAEIIRMTEHEICREIPEKELKKLITSIFFLAETGYLSLNGFTGVSKDDIVKSLREAGVKPGDFLLVHSSLSSFGYINGGVETVFAALKEAVGESGTFLVPLLRNVFANLDGPGSSINFRHFDKYDADSVWTGLLPRYILENNLADAYSNHITHAWAGCGAKAAEACAAHGMAESPCSKNSPLAYALNNGGKIVHLGSRTGATTFLHYFEDEFELPGLADSLCVVKGVDNIPYTVSVPKNLPGCREFYKSVDADGKFFDAACAQGLEVRKSPLSLGRIICMDMQPLYNIGCTLVKNDPYIFLHDQGTCQSCDRLRKLYDQKQKLFCK